MTAPALLSLLLLFQVSSPSSPGSALANPSFEEGGFPPAHWKLIGGARNREKGPPAEVVPDSRKARSGRRSIRIRGNASTASWPALVQDVPVEPGDRVVLRAAASCKEIRREGNQFVNAGAFLFFLSPEGRVLKRAATEVLSGTRPWVDLFAHALAPPGAARVRVGLVLTMSGTLWVDDLRLEVTHTTPFDARARAAAYRALWTHLGRTWPFFGLPGKPSGPGEVFRPYLAKALSAPTPGSFLEVCRRALAGLKDLHTWIRTPRGVRGTVPMATFPRNWNLQAIRASLERVFLEERNLLVGRMKAGPGYALIATFQLQGRRLARLQAALDRLSRAPSLILDVRANGGGREQAALAVARRFADKKVVYALHRFRDPTLGGFQGFGPTKKRIISPLAGKAPDRRPVAVLQGPYCVSSTEAFLLMAKALPNLFTLGLPSRGASGNPAPFEILPGCQVWSSRWQSLDPRGKCLEGIGVTPDILVKVPPKAYEKSDPTLEKALEILKHPPLRYKTPPGKKGGDLRYKTPPGKKRGDQVRRSSSFRRRASSWSLPKAARFRKASRAGMAGEPSQRVLEGRSS